MPATSCPRRMPCPTPDERSASPNPAPRHHDDPPPAQRTWWVPVVRMSVAAAVVGAIPHTSISLPFSDGAWMLHTAAGLIFMVGAIDSLFLFVMRRKP
ncbi:hypothetical protein [Ralstonia sp. 24A2]|uniref:hypothetical protein n=1 Tax=Ralstonia sp. 24A2 TaxID=3447364 RepID=UPI003F697E09